MQQVISMIGQNGLWFMIIAVVAIGGWFKYREHELRVHQQMRTREMEHLQKMRWSSRRLRQDKLLKGFRYALAVPLYNQ